MSSFPSIGYLLADGYEEKYRDNSEYLPLSGGLAKRRKKYSRQYHTVSCTYLFTEAELATFKTFYESTINYGTSTFTWTDIDSVSQNVQMFNAEYVEQLIAFEAYTVSFTLEIL